ncbi:DUF1206 domain-containing protein [Paradesertivirga mongoliensis]|uniref:DUF1206 domain-containing protein n=1 Tax=Paradesertivirga mongoliensis TaxID=2100740 RepID=A0ABW4ZQE5_9SPHI|nr:DUF1206 domain-containing protein [Pedobacter mongoliensis]
MNLKTSSSWIKPIAKLGLAAKGIVYCLIGLLAIMSAFHLGGQTSEKTNKEGVFQFILEQPAGKLILAVITLGLFCYAVWRFLQTFLDTERKGSNAKGFAKRFSYFFSGLTYLALAFFSLKFVLNGRKGGGGGSSQKDTVSDILNQPFGQWLLGIVALIIAGIGVYQIWYGNSEKYRKHVDLQELDHDAARSLMRAGKIGYISRGIVWLIIAFLFLKATLNNKASEAGDTASAFGFVEQSSFGTYLLAALGLGLICYGVMNFVRAVFEKIKF